MRRATVYFKGEAAGTLSQRDDGSFIFQYDQAWVADARKPPISLTLPKTVNAYTSPHLFPFFYNMLPEGSNKQVATSRHRIDSQDYFGLLLTTAKCDTIGAITVAKLDQP